MNPGDDHADPPPSDVSPPAHRAWLDAYVDHRLAGIGRELAGDTEGTDLGTNRIPPPPAPHITARELAPYLAELAERYRSRTA
ncbi:hypothetical protein ACFOVU_01040 [Nocardiopsis sediminis]|uniref:Uncharacterized protein n=1 Tax=Nocardiopsis sediminis TaxID=1778267 RepID=A0ABV8FHC7_9ACTN